MDWFETTESTEKNLLDEGWAEKIFGLEKNESLKKLLKKGRAEMEIPLHNKQGDVIAHAKCSPKDYAHLSQMPWYKNKAYAKVNDGNNLDMLMHKYVMVHLMKTEVPKGKKVDHKNGDGLDNRRENLRIVTAAQNAANRKKRKNASSKYYGVSQKKASEKNRLKNDSYVSSFHADGETIVVGYFKTEIEAAEAYDMCLAHHPKYGTEDQLGNRFNWPEKIEEYRAKPYVPQRQNTKSGKYASKFIGVQKAKKGKYAVQKYCATIYHDGKTHYICGTPSEEAAAKAYDDYVYKHKLNRKFNFPERYLDHNPSVVKTRMMDVDENTVRLIVGNNENIIFLIDREDYDKIKHYKLTESDGRVKMTVNKKRLLVHRFIMNQLIWDGKTYVDHIDKNPYNNKKSNLRVVVPVINGQNKTKTANASSKYYGVSLKLSNKSDWTAWQVIVYQGGRKVLCTTEKDEEWAARRRDLYIMNHIPASGYTMNFVWTEEDKVEWMEKLGIGREAVIEKGKEEDDSNEDDEQKLLDEQSEEEGEEKKAKRRRRRR